MNANHKEIMMQICITAALGFLLFGCENIDTSRKQPLEIESRFLIVSEEFLEDIGLKTNSIYNADGKFKPAIVESPASAISETYSFILDDLHVSFLLRATQAHEDAKVLTAPKVTVLDGEEAAFSIHRQVNYISGYTEPNRTSGEPEPKRDFVNKGLQLQVTPKITPDNKHILLNVGFELSELLGFEERMYKEKYPYKIPQMEVVSAKTRVSVPNGGTVLMAGYKVTAEEDGRKVQRELLLLIKAKKVDSEDLPVLKGGYGGYRINRSGAPRYGGYGGGYGGYGGSARAPAGAEEAQYVDVIVDTNESAATIYRYGYDGSVRVHNVKPAESEESEEEAPERRD